MINMKRMLATILSVICILLCSSVCFSEVCLWDIGNNENYQYAIMGKEIGANETRIYEENRYMIDSDLTGGVCYVDCDTNLDGSYAIGFTNGIDSTTIDILFDEGIQHVYAIRKEYIYYSVISKDGSYRLKRKSRDGIEEEYDLSFFYGNEPLSISDQGFVYFDGTLYMPESKEVICVRDYLPEGVRMWSESLSAATWIDDETLLFWAEDQRESPFTIYNWLALTSAESYLFGFDVIEKTVKPITTVSGMRIHIPYDVINVDMNVYASKMIITCAGRKCDNYVPDGYYPPGICNVGEILMIDMSTGSYDSVLSIDRDTPYCIKGRIMVF